jgi:hypothetical protein
MAQEKDETQAAPAGEPVRVLGSVHLGKKLGEGGMGAVYRGFHTLLRKDVAVKLILPQFLAYPGARERFLREARLATEITAEEVVRLFECGVQDGEYYMVMEFVDGGGLDQLLAREGPLPVARAARIILDVARGLQLAHRKGIIHRDIKPANILLTKDGRAKIADLGLAKSLGPAYGPGSSGGTSVGVPMGSPGYMAPEQIADTSSVDHRADIFSLGATLYLMVAGKEAFSGSSVEQVFASTVGSPPAPLTGEAAARLGGVIDKMLAKNREERYASYEELIADLERSLAEPSARPEPSSFAPIVPTGDSLGPVSLGSRRTLLVAGVVVVALLAGGVLCFTRQGAEVEPPNPPARATASLPAPPAQPPAPAALPAKSEEAPMERSRGVGDGADSVAPEVKAAIELAYTKPLSGAGPQAEVRLLAQSGRGASLSWRALPNGAALTSADGYRVEVRPASAGYLYVFQVDSRGKLDLIFPRLPQARFSIGKNPVGAGAPITLPDARRAFHLDQRLGVEQVYTVMTGQRWEELEQALVRASRVPPRPKPVEAPVVGRDRGIGAVTEVTAPAEPLAPAARPLSGEKVAALVTGTKGVLVVERWFNHVAARD